MSLYQPLSNPSVLALTQVIHWTYPSVSWLALLLHISSAHFQSHRVQLLSHFLAFHYIVYLFYCEFRLLPILRFKHPTLAGLSDKSSSFSTKLKWNVVAILLITILSIFSPHSHQSCSSSSVSITAFILLVLPFSTSILNYSIIFYSCTLF